MKLRKLHIIVGMIFAPFFLITSLTGIALLWRKDEIYGREVKDLMLGLHNWESGAKYIGAVLGVALLFMTITGIIMGVKALKRGKRN